MRVERAPRGRVCTVVFEATIPGLFVKKRIPMGGGWNSYEVVSLFVTSNFRAFRRGLQESPESRGPENPPPKKTQSGGRNSSMSSRSCSPVGRPSALAPCLDPFGSTGATRL